MFFFYLILPTTPNSLIIGEGITDTGIGIFGGFNVLESVTLPNTVTEIPNASFNDCGSLTSINIPDSVTLIGYYAFGGTALESIILPAGLEELEEGVFLGCSSLKKVDMSKCTKLTTLPGEVLSQCESLEEIILPAGLEGIDGLAFSGCPALTTIDMSKCTNLTTLSANTFSGCENLTTIILPPNVTSIEKHAFPSSLETISLALADGTVAVLDNSVVLGTGTIDLTSYLDDSDAEYALEYVPLESVDYLKVAGTELDSMKAIALENTYTGLYSGTYVVNGTLELSDITIYGEVTLILADGATLTVSGDIGGDHGTVLNIYSQGGTTLGKLTATNIACSNFNFYGGNVTASKIQSYSSDGGVTTLNWTSTNDSLTVTTFSGTVTFGSKFSNDGTEYFGDATRGCW